VQDRPGLPEGNGADQGDGQEDGNQAHVGQA